MNPSCVLIVGMAALVGAGASTRDPGQAARKLVIAADLLQEGGKHALALAEYEKALQLAPKLVEAHHGYQDTMEALGKRKEVLSQYRRRLTRTPDSAMVHYLYGRLVTDLDEKRKLYQKAAKLAPKFFWAHYGLGYLCEREQKWPESEAAFKRAIAVRPSSAEAHHGLGFCYMGQGKDEHAVREYQAALKIDPHYVESLLNLSVIDLRRHDYDGAIEHCKRVLETDKDNPWAYNNLGKAYYGLFRLSEALKAFRAALANPRYDTPEIGYLNLGFVYHRQRKHALAEAAYKKAIEHEPDFPYAYEALAQVQFHQKKYDEAWKSVKKAQEFGHGVRPAFIKALVEATGKKME